MKKAKETKETVQISSADIAENYIQLIEVADTEEQALELFDAICTEPTLSKSEKRELTRVVETRMKAIRFSQLRQIAEVVKSSGKRGRKKLEKVAFSDFLASALNRFGVSEKEFREYLRKALETAKYFSGESVKFVELKRVFSRQSAKKAGSDYKYANPLKMELSDFSRKIATFDSELVACAAVSSVIFLDHSRRFECVEYLRQNFKVKLDESKKIRSIPLILPEEIEEKLSENFLFAVNCFPRKTVAENIMKRTLPQAVA